MACAFVSSVWYGWISHLSEFGQRDSRGWVKTWCEVFRRRKECRKTCVLKRAQLRLRNLVARGRVPKREAGVRSRSVAARIGGAPRGAPHELRVLQDGNPPRQTAAVTSRHRGRAMADRGAECEKCFNQPDHASCGQVRDTRGVHCWGLLGRVLERCIREGDHCVSCILPFRASELTRGLIRAA